ncbi:putative G3BP-like protein [Phalaenopsis equestris]|uniref:putative G3BP-like protein n=1 Tax=Phalaenopsis equestris TaxID=78828 RepID=UPI0009E1F7C2|nr:putative G3BP-like protein [Phalaenopsis equestris]
MASALTGQVSAAQVGSYFLGQYYHFLQQNPNLAHQFYTDASTMIRYDGVTNESASGMAEIHNLIISLNFTEIEIKTANSLESLGGGVLVMVTGLVQAKDFICRRKFVETFFLAPQEKGYFVLNDIFLLHEEEQVLQHSVATLTHDDYDTNLDTLNPIEEPVSSYMLEEDIPAEDYNSTPLSADENNTLNNFCVPEEPNEAPNPDEIVDETPAELPTCSFSSEPPKDMQEPPAPVEEPVREPPKHTYASILRTSRPHAAPHLSSINKTGAVLSERHHASPSTQLQAQPIVSNASEKSSSEVLDEVSTFEDEGDSKSVYVGNIPPNISSSDLEQEFRKFGRITLDGVTIRSRKDGGFYYAFVEFEDAVGVQNALKASPVQLNGRLVHVEGRRPNSGASRGGRRGRGRGGYNLEASRGRFGSRSFRQ